MAIKTKDREDQLDDDREPAPPESQERDEGGDDEPDSHVKEKDGNQVVETSGLTRGQRRAAQREQQRREQAERERKTHELINRMQTQIETLTSAIANPGRQAPQQSSRQVESQDDWDKATDRQMELSISMQNTTDPSERSRIMGEWRKLEREKTAFLAKGTVSKDIEAIRQNMNQPTGEQRALAAEFHDVLSNRRARALAQGYYNAAEAEAEDAGRPFDQAKAFREANLRAARETNLRSDDSPEPTDVQRRRFGGSGPSVGGKTDGSFSRPLTKIEIWTAKEWARSEGLPEEKAVSAWTKMMLKDDPHYFRDNIAG